MSVTGIVHTGFAVAALIVGLGIFLLPKGTKLHRAAGIKGKRDVKA